MKKILAICLALIALTGAFGACGKNETKKDRITLTCTIFPLYDWTREIIGEEKDRFDLKLMLDTGVDLHSFQPTVQDITRLAGSDLFLYVGGESDDWAKDALQNAGKGVEALALLDFLGDRAKTEEAKEGMEEHEHGEEEHEEEEKDEHVWLSLRLASLCCREICERVCALDPDRAEIYRNNRDGYLKKLSELDDAYSKAVREGKRATLIFGDRFPFRYLTDDYGLDYYAAFKGCSAETEASFQTVVFLAKKADETGAGAILALETSDGAIARTVRENTAGKDQRILTLDSLQSTTLADAEGGKTYLAAMEKNLEVLREALR